MAAECQEVKAQHSAVDTLLLSCAVHGLARVLLCSHQGHGRRDLAISCSQNSPAKLVQREELAFQKAVEAAQAQAEADAQAEVARARVREAEARVLAEAGGVGPEADAAQVSMRLSADWPVTVADIAFLRLTVGASSSAQPSPPDPGRHQLLSCSPQ